MKIYHFYPTHKIHFGFMRQPEMNRWHIWFGMHAWTIQFSCKCSACRVARWRKAMEWLIGEKITDEDLLAASKNLGTEQTMNQAITQERFREAQRRKNV